MNSNGQITAVNDTGANHNILYMFQNVSDDVVARPEVEFRNRATIL